MFLRLVSGFIFLSNSSRRDFIAAYPNFESAPHLITRHGRYPDGTDAPSPRRLVSRDIRLLMFGLIREYKNVIGLIQAFHAANDPDITLTIVGTCFDPGLRDRIELASNGSNRINLDLRSDLLTDSELNAIIDAHDGVVLPYTKILNSGVALHAIGRNKPILAPAIGSLPELEQSLGQDWVSLFKPPFDQNAVRLFANHLRAGGPERADLSAYDWNTIGAEIAHFIMS
ncbi:glycosyltransferase [Sphingomonas qomolangmaensis]|uniref:Glycosyl transferase family 1 domain-containing protein n=1 Tax=Sphingomonas qomolangmaensis TaxID=2918765 RepID=A0ABY5L600_9SPHN|nr:hypothetical protein [Sphingomonas qomolangmaensis]UUL82375.1 hypothetical protein NMP03_14540 [Sphingomonas qomolangmaensis]